MEPLRPVAEGPAAAAAPAGPAEPDGAEAAAGLACPPLRHPLGFFQLPAGAYRRGGAVLVHRGFRARVAAVYAAIGLDVLVNAYTEPIASRVRSVHILTFSLQICTLMFTLLSFLMFTTGSPQLARSPAARTLTKDFRALGGVALVYFALFFATKAYRLALVYQDLPYLALADRPVLFPLTALQKVASIGYYAGLLQVRPGPSPPPPVSAAPTAVLTAATSASTFTATPARRRWRPWATAATDFRARSWREAGGKGKDFNRTCYT